MSSRAAQFHTPHLKALYFIPQSIIFIVSSLPFASFVSVLPPLSTTTGAVVRQFAGTIQMDEWRQAPAMERGGVSRTGRRERIKPIS